MSLYQELKDAGVPLDHHESDLYALYTNTSRTILAGHRERSFTTFKSEVDGKIWFDIPFAYEPFWDSKPR